MAVKTITITEEAYNALRRIKYGDRSFSEVIIEVVGSKKNNLDKYFGVLYITDQEAEAYKARIKKIKEETNKSIEKNLAGVRKGFS